MACDAEKQMKRYQHIIIKPVYQKMLDISRVSKEWRVPGVYWWFQASEWGFYDPELMSVWYLLSEQCRYHKIVGIKNATSGAKGESGGRFSKWLRDRFVAIIRAEDYIIYRARGEIKQEPGQRRMYLASVPYRAYNTMWVYVGVMS